jgi:hypothetical protein
MNLGRPFALRVFATTRGNEGEFDGGLFTVRRMFVCRSEDFVKARKSSCHANILVNRELRRFSRADPSAGALLYQSRVAALPAIRLSVRVVR